MDLFGFFFSNHMRVFVDFLLFFLFFSPSGLTQTWAIVMARRRCTWRPLATILYVRNWLISVHFDWQTCLIFVSDMFLQFFLFQIGFFILFGFDLIWFFFFSARRRAATGSWGCRHSTRRVRIPQSFLVSCFWFSSFSITSHHCFSIYIFILNFFSRPSCPYPHTYVVFVTRYRQTPYDLARRHRADRVMARLAPAAVGATATVGAATPGGRPPRGPTRRRWAHYLHYFVSVALAKVRSRGIVLVMVAFIW